jgi:hypothetical protein
VTNGLAGIKFSVSPRRKGLVSTNVIIAQNMIIKPNKSLKEKYGWNGILSEFEFIPEGLLDPVWCKKRR